MRRAFLLLVAAAAFIGGARGQELAASPSPTGRGRFAALSNELALYSPLESPWADLRVNHAFESHLFSLMRAEVRLWDLQDALAAQEGPVHDDATEIGRIVHEQVLAGAAEALPLLQKTPNPAFARLLVHQLEAYPYEWKEDGSEGLLPNLHKLADPPSGNPPPVRRQRAKPRPPASPAP